MRTLFSATGWVAVMLLSGAGCSQTRLQGNPRFEQKLENFVGVAKNTGAGARLQLDNGSSITCVVETENSVNVWPDDVSNARIQVGGYRVRSDSADPNGIVLRCLIWTKVTAETEARNPQVIR